MFYFIRYCKIVISNQLGVPPNFLKDLRGAANQKRLKNTALISDNINKLLLNLFSFFLERYHSIDTKMKGNPLSLEEMILMTIYS